jgi:hypothetical protein
MDFLRTVFKRKNGKADESFYHVSQHARKQKTASAE